MDVLSSGSVVSSRSAPLFRQIYTQIQVSVFLDSVFVCWHPFITGPIALTIFSIFLVLQNLWPHCWGESAPPKASQFLEMQRLT